MAERTGCQSVSDFQGHPRWMIFILFKTACAIFY